MERYRIAYDQFQRYETVSKLVNFHRHNGKKFRILEIGANEHKDLSMFLPYDDILFSDIKLTDEMKMDPAFVQIDGTAIPFADQAFDFVIALDVLEHIHGNMREKFSAETFRVSRFGALLSFPYCSNEILNAESRINSFYRGIDGNDFIWLKEHIENGLPNINEIDQIIQKYVDYSFSFYHGSVQVWETLQYFQLYAYFAPEVLQYIKCINLYYNTYLYKKDVHGSCYRIFYVMSRSDVFDWQHYADTLWDKSMLSQSEFNYLYELLKYPPIIHTLYAGKIYQLKNISDTTLPVQSVSVYFDNGDGFSEILKEERNATPIEKQFFTYREEIIFEKNVKAIRIDPIEGDSCIVTDLRIEIVGGSFTIETAAAPFCSDTFILSGPDPQIVLNISEHGCGVLKISFSLILLNRISFLKLSKILNINHYEEYYHIKTTLQSEIEGLKNQRENLCLQLTQHKKRYLKLQKQFKDTNKIVREEISKLKIENSTLKQKNDNYIKRIIDISNIENRWLNEIYSFDKLQKELDEAYYEKSRLQHELDTLKAQHEVLKKREIQKHIESYDEYNTEIACLQKKLSEFKEYCDYVENSFSWKITKPLRYFKMLLK